MNKRKTVLYSNALAALAVHTDAQTAPEPYGLVSSERQREWYNRERIAFFHFSTNIFEESLNEEDGRAPVVIFNPTALDCNQWMGSR